MSTRSAVARVIEATTRATASQAAAPVVLWPEGNAYPSASTRAPEAGRGRAITILMIVVVSVAPATVTARNPRGRHEPRTRRATSPTTRSSGITTVVLPKLVRTRMSAVSPVVRRSIS
jgi:hypothetical protein